MEIHFSIGSQPALADTMLKWLSISHALTSGGPDPTQRILELKIVIWTSLRNRLSSPAIDFLWVIYRS